MITEEQWDLIAAQPENRSQACTVWGANQPHLEDSFDMKLLSPAGYAAEYKNVRSFKTCVPRNKALSAPEPILTIYEIFVDAPNSLSSAIFSTTRIASLCRTSRRSGQRILGGSYDRLQADHESMLELYQREAQP